MSSATSIKQNVRSVRVKPDPAPRDTPALDDGFRPWHFFVLMSLVAATAAVVMARQATPEHLILISFTIAAAGVAAAALYRTLAPLAAEDLSMFSEPLTGRSRAALEREKALVLRSIKELEFDRAMGKLSPKDFDEMAGRLRARAVALIRQLDEGDSGYREVIERELAARVATVKRGVSVPQSPLREAAPVPASVAAPEGLCTSCGTRNDADAAFCKRCGTQLAHSAGGAQSRSAR